MRSDVSRHEAGQQLTGLYDSCDSLLENNCKCQITACLLLWRWSVWLRVFLLLWLAVPITYSLNKANFCGHIAKENWNCLV